MDVTMLINKTHPLPENFRPEGLIDLDSQEMQLYRGWLERNSWRFGYILRYLKGREHIMGIGYEPWHFRYVGESLAAILHEKDWTLEEYDSEVTGGVSVAAPEHRGVEHRERPLCLLHQTKPD